MEWPEDETATVYYPELITPLRRVLLKGYRMLRRKRVTSIPYEGYAVPVQVRAADGLPAAERFLKPNLDYHAERGRTLLDLVLQMTYFYGMEQGCRIERDKARLALRVAHADGYQEGFRAGRGASVG